MGQQHDGMYWKPSLALLILACTALCNGYKVHTSLSNEPASACASRIENTRLNDDFCDCDDGSDDEWLTGACGTGTFTCTASGVKIPTSSVRDGVCDCCDGSDELATALCTNTCMNHRHKRVNRLKKILDDVQNGLKEKEATQAFLSNGKWKIDIDKAADTWEDIVEAAEEKLDTFTHRFQVERIQPTNEDRQVYQQLNAHVEYAQMQSYIHKKLASSSFGDTNEYAHLIGQCFDYEVNEKQLKGGTSNTIARTYVMVYCPFMNVTQTEPGYHEWRHAQKQAQIGDKYILPSTAASSEARERQRPILLGVWNDWTLIKDTDSIPSITVPFEPYIDIVQSDEYDVTSPHLAQVYNYGESCGGDIHRRVLVQMECSSYNHILFVEERQVCVYTIGFGTPAACTGTYASYLKQLLDEIIETSHDEL